MALELNSEDIIRGLRRARRIAPLSLNDQLLDTYINLVHKKQMVLKQNTKEWNQLQRCLIEPGGFIKDEIKHTLNRTALFVLPFPICVAYSEIIDGKTPAIVISTGLIDLIASSILLAQFGAKLPPELETYYFLKLRRDMDANKLLMNAIFLSQVNFYRYGQPLPNITSMLSEKAMVDSQIAINGAITFVLLHELGHHQLGHILAIPVDNKVQHKTLIPENLNIYMKQEFDADNFALGSTKEEVKIVGTFWQQQAMTFFTSLELVTGSQLDLEHPMSINRSFSSDQLREEWGKEHEVQSRSLFFEKLAERYKSTADHKTEEFNAFVNTSYDGCLNTISQMKETYGEFGLDLAGLYGTSAFNWLKINECLDS